MARDYTQAGRLAADFQKTFKTTSGKYVLMELYTAFGGNRSSFQEGAPPEQTFVNEGMRRAWLYINDKLRLTPEVLNKLHQEYLDQRKREDEEGDELV